MNTQKKVYFLTTAHAYDDDRILYHQAKTLIASGYHVKITSLSSDFSGCVQGIEVYAKNCISEYSISQKKDFLLAQLYDYSPDVIICSEPLTVDAASTYRKTHTCVVVYDVTEWYPTKRQYADVFVLLRPFIFFAYFMYNLVSGKRADAFIFGEEYKQYPFKLVFPKKKRILLPYYPHPDYIFFKKKMLNPSKLCLCYTGRISKENGTFRFLHVAHKFIQQNPHVDVSILLVGNPKTAVDAEKLHEAMRMYMFENITHIPFTHFLNYTKVLQDVDICFDLRDMSVENSYSLPIKLFYYVACGKPILYTKSKAISKHMDISKYGFLVNPDNTAEIVEKIQRYVKNPHVYEAHSSAARDAFLKKYNWKKIEQSFISYIQSLCNGI